MERMKELVSIWEQLLESLRPITQAIIAFFMGVFAHLDVCAAVLALVVLLLQLKVLYYKGRREKAAYEKECRGGPQ